MNTKRISATCRCTRIFRIAVSGIILSTSVGAASTYEVDLSGDRTLLPLFDAGLRPKIIPGIDNTCEIRQQRLAMKFVPDQTPIELDVEYLQILVGAEGQIRGYELRGKRRMTLDAAVVRAGEIMSALGMPTEAREELDKWAAKHEGKWTFLPFRGGGEVAHSIIAIEIMPSFFPKEPAVIGFHGRRIGADDEPSLRSPVKPPPGYEGVSMEYPGGQRMGEFTVADGTSLEEEPRPNSAASAPANERPPPAPASEDTVATAAKRGWWWALPAAVVAGIVAWVMGRNRLHRPG